MTPLLIVLAAGCVVALGGHFGRQLWVRARTVERHRHALDTLAGITQRAEVDGLEGGPEHQAHVRVVGPGAQRGPDGHPLLPPPRALSNLGPGRPSPFFRPSRMAPSAAAMEVAATADPLPRDATTRLVSSAQPSPQVRAPAHRPVGQHAGSAGTETPAAFAVPPPPRTAEGSPSAGPAAAPQPAGAGAAEAALPGEPGTRPLPTLQPQVYYFDDFAARAEGPVPSGRRARRRRDRAARSGGERPPDLDRTRPIDVAAIGSGARAASGSSRGRRQATAARWLAATAVAAAVAAIGITLAETWPSSSPKVASAGPSLAANAPTSTTRAPRRVVTTTVPTTLPPPKPAVLLSASQGNVTYQLHSATASIVVKASGRCWVEVRVGSPAGSIVTEETLVAGQSARVTGPAWVRLGNPPAVSVLVDGTTITVPGATQAVPMNLRFTLG